MRDGVARAVGPPEGRGAADGFEVDAPPAAGAIINDQSGMAPQQSIPKRIEPFDMPDLRNALAIRRVGGVPEGQGIHIEILAIAAQAELIDSAGDEIGDKLARLRVAEVEEDSVAPGVEEPVMVLRVPHGALNARAPARTRASIRAPRRSASLSGLKPRVKVFFDLPIAEFDRPAALAEPLGVDPIILDGQLVLDELADVVQVHFGAGAAPVAAGDGCHERLAVEGGAVMGEDELAEQVLSPPAVALVEQQQQARRADGLAGSSTRCVRASPAFRLTWPCSSQANSAAHSPLQPTAATTPPSPPCEVEERQHLVRGPSPARLEPQFFARPQRRRLGREIVKGGHAALGPVQRGFAAACQRQHPVQRLDPLEERCVRGAAIGQGHHPFHRREIGEAVGLDPDFQPRAGVEMTRSRRDECVSGAPSSVFLDQWSNSSALLAPPY